MQREEKILMKKNPNIVFILTDDQGFGDLGCTGNPIVQTPNIDSFYNESLRFTNFHVGPTCAPTRSGLMTGHFANSTGVWHTVGGRSLLRKDEVTLATALKNAGYETGIFGKWHLGDAYPYRPMDRGFNETVVHGGGGISQTPDYWGNDYFDDTYFVNGEPVEFKGYCTDVFFDEAIKFIEKNQNQPFFCFIPSNAPHLPYNVPNSYSKPYMNQTNDDRARFYGMITNIDENFARLRAKLSELNIEDDTIVIFMTDNGTSCGITVDASDYVIDGFNGGLRGGKNSEYDGGHRVPFFMKWTNGGFDVGKDLNQLTANVDFMPTLLDMCDVKEEKLEFHGMSLLPYMRGNEKGLDRTLVTDSQRVAYPVKWRKSAVMTNDWRLINGRELYEINQDREQRFDISHKYPEVVRRLRTDYDKWWKLVSTQYDEMIPYPIGEETIHITCHDLRNEECETAWNQRHIRSGLRIDGYYEVEIEKSGKYRFGLRRWPQSIDLPIAKGIIGQDIEFSKEFIQEKNWETYSGGEALQIDYAQIQIQGIIETKKVEEDDREAEFVLELEKGLTRLSAKFIGKDKEGVTAAYFVEISKA